MAPSILSANQMDLIFRRALLFSKLFTKSWGNPHVLKLIYEFCNKYTSKGKVMDLIKQNMPKMIIRKEYVEGEAKYQEGYFISPLYDLAPELFESQNVALASWQGIFPKDGTKNGLVIHLAGTGDHSFYRRRRGFANHLLKYGISSILLENPFYGSRKPKVQNMSSLMNVTDLYVMGGSLIAECCFILIWAKSEGFFPLAMSGVSMGGHMATLAITNVKDSNIAVVPCLSWTSGAPVYTLGALSTAIPWEVLQEELDKNQELRRTIELCGWFEEMEKGAPKALFPNSPAKRLMWSLMNHFTNLENYPKPKNAFNIHAIIAEEDAYVLRIKQIPELTNLWPGASVNLIRGAGHVSAYLLHHAVFRQAIIDSLSSIRNLKISASTIDQFENTNIDIRTSEREL